MVHKVARRVRERNSPSQIVPDDAWERNEVDIDKTRMEIGTTAEVQKGQFAGLSGLMPVLAKSLVILFRNVQPYFGVGRPLSLRA
jgi:hypothetical protein